MLNFIATYGLPDDVIVLQLYYDIKSKNWRYLFAPTTKAFGNFIDRIIDLETGKLILLESPENFINIVGASPKDGYVYIIDAYYHRDRR
jgi:hypothetical protein